MKNKKQLITDAVTELQEIVDRQNKGNSDIEGDHAFAEDVLLTLLKELGCKEVVDKWDEIEMWYA